MDLRERIFVNPAVTQQSVAEKAFKHIQRYFGELEFDDVQQILSGEVAQVTELKIQAEHYGAFLCVYAYSFQEKQIREISFSMVDFFAERYVNGSPPEKVYAMRLLALLSL